jgi:hypothetical protein
VNGEVVEIIVCCKVKSKVVFLESADWNKINVVTQIKVSGDFKE